MSHHYSVKATYNSYALLNGGIDAKSSAAELLSPLSLITFGFLYLINDIWVNADNIQHVTWTNDSCDTMCD